MLEIFKGSELIVSFPLKQTLKALGRWRSLQVLLYSAARKLIFSMAAVRSAFFVPFWAVRLPLSRGGEVAFAALNDSYNE